jgi:hypothetical protein
VTVTNGLVSSWPFLITRRAPVCCATNSRPSGAMAMAVGLGTCATSESVKPCGTVVALRAGSTFHHSSIARQAASTATATTDMTDNRARRIRSLRSILTSPFHPSTPLTTPPHRCGWSGPAKHKTRFGPVRGEGSFPDLVDTVREAGASPHRSKGQQKYRSSPVAVHEKAGAQCESSDPMREAGAPSTVGVVMLSGMVMCPPHRG